MKYEVYQKEKTDFMSLERLIKRKQMVDRKEYHLVYTGETKEKGTEEEILDRIYCDLNNDHRPNRDNMCSLSISDIVVLNGPKRKAFFVDSIGYQPLPYFFSPEFYIKFGKVKYQAETLEEAFSKYLSIPNHMEKEMGYIASTKPWAPLLACKNGVDEVDMDFNKYDSAKLDQLRKSLTSLLSQSQRSWLYKVVTEEEEYWREEEEEEKTNEFVHYLEVHNDGEGYDYTIYDENGSVEETDHIDTDAFDISEVVEDILEHYNGSDFSCCHIMDYEALEDL